MVTGTEVVTGMVMTMVTTMAIMTVCTTVGTVMADTTAQEAIILMGITIGIIITIIDREKIIVISITDLEEVCLRLSPKIIPQD